MIDPLNPLDDEIVSVGSTNLTGGLQATRHPIEMGHRRVAYLGGPRSSAASQERLQGNRAALTQGGLPTDDRLVLEGGFDYEAGLAMATEVLALDHPPTGIFAGCDASALGVLEAARHRQLQVPEDLSIVGFDDTYAAMAKAA